MYAQLYRDYASLVVLLDLANREVGIHLKPLNLRALVHEHINACLVVGHGLLALHQINEYVPYILNVLVWHVETSLVEAVQPTIIVSFLQDWLWSLQWMLTYLDHHSILALRRQCYALADFGDNFKFSVLDVRVGIVKVRALLVDLLALADRPLGLLGLNLHKDAALPCRGHLGVAIHQVSIRSHLVHRRSIDVFPEVLAVKLAVAYAVLQVEKEGADDLILDHVLVHDLHHDAA